MFMGNRARPVRKSDSLTAICEPDCVDNVGSLIFHNPIGLHGLIVGIV
jgi:hypothetical protein